MVCSKDAGPVLSPAPHAALMREGNASSRDVPLHLLKGLSLQGQRGALRVGTPASRPSSNCPPTETSQRVRISHEFYNKSHLMICHKLCHNRERESETEITRKRSKKKQRGAGVRSGGAHVWSRKEKCGCSSSLQEADGQTDPQGPPVCPQP